MTPLLDVHDLSINFYTRERIIEALAGVSFGLAKSETLGFVGEAGSGKSVLTQGLLNLVMRPGKIDKGTVVYGEKDLLKLSDSEIRPIRGNEIAVITSHPKSALNPVLTIGAQISNAYLAHRSGTKQEALEASIQALRAVGINDPETRIRAYPHELSGGMAQRVIVAISLLHSPKILIADEPTAGLDVTIQRQVLEMINDLIIQKHMSTIISTRDLGIIAHYCKRVAVLQKGRIVELAPVEKLFQNGFHPYTRRLLSSSTLGKIELFSKVNNSEFVPFDINKVDSDLFCNRCFGDITCPEAKLIEINPGHWVRCHA